MSVKVFCSKCDYLFHNRRCRRTIKEDDIPNVDEIVEKSNGICPQCHKKLALDVPIIVS